MAITIKDAKAVCTATELELVKQSRDPATRSLTAAALRRKRDRARKLRDKFRDLSKRQKREARGKARPQGRTAAAGADRTDLKADLFDEVLGRFEALLARAEAAASGTSAKAGTARVAKKKKKKTAAKSKTGTSSEAESGAGAARGAGGGDPPAARPAKSGGRTAAAAKARTSVTLRGSGATIGADPFAGSLADQASRETRRRVKSASAIAGSQESHFAGTAQSRLRGFVSGRTRAAQSKRDSRG